MRRIGWLWRVLVGRPRLLSGLVCGIAVYLVYPDHWMAATRLIAAWNSGITVFLLLTAVLFFGDHRERMEVFAERQKEGEWTIFSLTVAGVVVSLVAIIREFSFSKSIPASTQGLHLAIVGYTLFASWLMTHATFALRYAHEYYERSCEGADIDRGLDFPKEDRPDYLDFTYFALVLGMTFQVSDVNITSRKLRRLATLHGLLSFLFNTIIVALTVNLAAGLM